MMIRRRSLTLFILLLVGGVKIQTTVWGQQSGPFVLRPIVSTGQPGPAEVPLSGYGAIAMNARGDLAFIAGDHSGLYLFWEGELMPVALSTMAVAQLPGVFFDEFTALAVNGGGDIAFAASIYGARDGVGLFLYARASGEITPLVFSGDRVPGPVFANFQDFPDVFINDDREIAFTGRFRNTETGAFLVVNQAIEPIAIPRQEAPGTDGGTFAAAAVRSLANNGTMLIQGSVRNGSASSGIFLYRNGALEPVVLTGQVAPGTGGIRFSRLSNARLITEDGDIAFEGFALGGGMAGGGIFSVIDGELAAVVLGGRPIAAAGGKRILEFSSISSNLAGTFAFPVTFEEQAQGLFVFSEGRLDLVAFSERQVTGGFARRFIPRGATAVNARGGVAFVGETRRPTTTGIYLVEERRLRAVVTSQMPVPLPSRLRLGGDVALNDDGAVAFSGLVTGSGKGMYLLQGATITSLAVPSQSVPGASGSVIGKLENVIGGRTSLTGEQEIAVVATLSGDSADVGLFRASPGGLEAVILIDEEAPASIVDFEGVRMNESGTIAFTGFIVDRGDVREGIGLIVNGRVRLIASEGTRAPGGGRFLSFLGHDLWINEAGQVVFVAELEDGRQGLYSSSGNRLRALAVSGQSAPGTSSATFETFESVMVNDRGLVVFTSQFSEGGGGLFATDGEVIQPILLSGDVAPGTEGQPFREFGQVAVNEAGEVIVIAGWGGLGRGIFFVGDGRMAAVALSGHPVPGQDDSRFSRFFGLAMNDNGEIVFSAALDGAPVPSAIFLATAR